MILNRLGNKSSLANLIIAQFPPHDIFIDMFFGAGGIFFAKPKSKHNFLNDLECDVTNLFLSINDNPDLLYSKIESCPLSVDLIKFWGKNVPKCRYMKAVRFLILSNCTLLGLGSSLRIEAGFSKSKIYKNYSPTKKKIKDCYFLNFDFRELLNNIVFNHNRKDKQRAFIYADPPYLGTANNYSNSFTETDTQDLFKILCESNIRFAISEFDNPIILDLANDYGLNVITIGERQNLKNRRTEILITNYQKRQMELFDFSQSFNSV